LLDSLLQEYKIYLCYEWGSIIPPDEVAQEPVKTDSGSSLAVSASHLLSSSV